MGRYFRQGGFASGRIALSIRHIKKQRLAATVLCITLPLLG
ncbi:hypothetical protein yaldo0001_30450 [Yersinia aldovae ATCC 35236]|nr:hypothetical protein yaldo0001_30450 [Yersinia aldovae ATCC 35236]